jgi:hypothetical protein
MAAHGKEMPDRAVRMISSSLCGLAHVCKLRIVEAMSKTGECAYPHFSVIYIRLFVKKVDG